VKGKGALEDAAGKREKSKTDSSIWKEGGKGNAYFVADEGTGEKGFCRRNCTERSGRVLGGETALCCEFASVLRVKRERFLTILPRMTGRPQPEVGETKDVREGRNHYFTLGTQVGGREGKERAVRERSWSVISSQLTLKDGEGRPPAARGRGGKIVLF